MKPLLNIPTTKSNASGSLIDDYLAAKKGIFARSTYKTAIHLLRTFSDDIRPGSIESLTYSGIEAWHRSLTGRSYRISTVCQYLTRAKALYTWAVKTGRIEKSPFVGYQIPRGPKKMIIMHYQRQARDILFSAAAGTGLETILQLGFYAGLRYSEIDAAQWDWISEDEITVQTTDTWTPKTASSTRNIPLNSALRAHLQSLPHSEKYICHPERPYKPESRYRWYCEKLMRTLAEENNLTPLTSHMMRRTFATLHAKAGTPITNIATWLGDDIKTTYTHYIGYYIDQKQIDAIC